MNFKKLLIIHPLLFAIYPILFLFSYNLEQITFNEIILPVIVVLAITVLLLLLSGLIFKDNVKHL